MNVYMMLARVFEVIIVLNYYLEFNYYLIIYLKK
jgi:hypothetical protein